MTKIGMEGNFFQLSRVTYLHMKILIFWTLLKAFSVYNSPKKASANQVRNGEAS
jgi:hypothetical protein